MSNGTERIELNINLHLPIDVGSESEWKREEKKENILPNMLTDDRLTIKSTSQTHFAAIVGMSKWKQNHCTADAAAAAAHFDWEIE